MGAQKPASPFLRGLHRKKPRRTTAAWFDLPGIDEAVLKAATQSPAFGAESCCRVLSSAMKARRMWGLTSFWMRVVYVGTSRKTQTKRVRSEHPTIPSGACRNGKDIVRKVNVWLHCLFMSRDQDLGIEGLPCLAMPVLSPHFLKASSAVSSFFTFRVWGPGFRVCRSPKP